MTTVCALYKIISTANTNLYIYNTYGDGKYKKSAFIATDEFIKWGRDPSSSVDFTLNAHNKTIMELHSARNQYAEQFSSQAINN